MPLSAKAKGKQRAINPEEDSQNPQVVPDFGQVVVRFTEGIPDVTFALDPGYTIKDVKVLICEHRPALLNRHLRIIVTGRLLTDDIRLQDWLTHNGTRPSVAPRRGLQPKDSTIIQCAVGTVIQPGEEVKEKSEQVAPSLCNDVPNQTYSLGLHSNSSTQRV